MTKTNDTDHGDDVEAVLTNTGTCILGCLDVSGNPYLTSLLYDYADGGIYLAALEQTNWSQYLQRDERVALYITGKAHRVMIQGRAQQVDEPLYMRRLLDRRSVASSEPAGSAGQKRMSEQHIGQHTPPADPEQEMVSPRPSMPTWFFVRSIGLFIQRGGVWMRHNVTPIRRSIDPHTR